MIEQTVIETQRLQLRPLELSDASAIQKVASTREVADTMISLPHPYPLGESERYIARKQVEREVGRSITFIIEKKTEREFYGVIEVRDIDREHSQGELSFWLVVEAWGMGYMSEVVQAVVRFGFEVLSLNRLYAYHMLRNQASSRIFEKNGFRQEGLLHQRVRKWGQYEDVALWAILRQEWKTAIDN
ncbi:MAG: GNAT family N-acetyltransferase [Bacteroidota bacterium]